jgi:hypothetical protein
MFTPGDWLDIARGIAELTARPEPHAVRDAERSARYSSAAASERIARAYSGLLEA